MLMTVFVAVKIEAEQLRSVPRSFSFHWSNAPRHVVSFNGFKVLVFILLPRYPTAGGGA